MKARQNGGFHEKQYPHIDRFIHHSSCIVLCILQERHTRTGQQLLRIINVDLFPEEPTAAIYGLLPGKTAPAKLSLPSSVMVNGLDCEIYSVWFKDNPYLKELTINFTYSLDEVAIEERGLSNNPELKKVIVNNFMSKTLTFRANSFNKSPKLETVEINIPDECSVYLDDDCFTGTALKTITFNKIPEAINIDSTPFNGISNLTVVAPEGFATKFKDQFPSDTTFQVAE